MSIQQQSDECSVSTTWAFRKVKIRTAPQANGTARRRRSSKLSLRRRDARERLSIVIMYRGGSEAWWVIEARGERWTFPGHRSLHDALWSINEGNGIPEGSRRQPKS